MIHWLIQKNIDRTDAYVLIRELLRQNICVTTVKYNTGMEIEFNKHISDTCVICYGNIDFVRKVQKQYKWIPGAWCNFHNMMCSVYYTYFGKYLLNRHYSMMSLGELLMRWEDITSVINDIPLFIRPNSGTKLFAGQVIEQDRKDKIQALIHTVGEETLAITSLAKTIDSEFRFVVCNREVITGCKYLPIESTETSPSSLRLAKHISSLPWQPDLCYTIDIAEHRGDVYLLEINSFSCAGFYSCDISSIVKNASRCAVDYWKEYCYSNV